MDPVVRARTPRSPRPASAAPVEAATDPLASLPKHERVFLADEAATAAERGLTVSEHRDQVATVLSSYHTLYVGKVTDWVAHHVRTSSLAPRLDVDVLVQDAFYRVHRGLLRGKVLETPLTYLTKAGTSAFLDEVRKLNAERTAEVDHGPARDGEAEAPPIELADSRPDPEASLRHHEEERALLQSLRDFTPDQRRALLRDKAHTTTAELAAQLGMTEGTLKSITHRARKRLLPLLAARLGVVRGSGTLAAPGTGRVRLPQQVVDGLE